VPAKLYVALGDSMTISYYPSIDAATRYGRRIDNLGAARLLHTNNDELFPEFKGNDLRSHYRNIEIDDLSSDGATLPTVEDQVERLDRNAAIITLTVGGNDLLGALATARSIKDIAASTERISKGFTKLAKKIRSDAPNAFLILTTVYDPTDETGRLPGMNEVLPLEFLHRFNDHVRRTAIITSRCTLADVHEHFLGHGVKVPVAKRWYWSESIIEPGFAGASEIRRMWWNALQSEIGNHRDL
jgi:lysophospholipase L1-like esterase